MKSDQEKNEMVARASGWEYADGRWWQPGFMPGECNPKVPIPDYGSDRDAMFAAVLKLSTTARWEFTRELMAVLEPTYGNPDHHEFVLLVHMSGPAQWREAFLSSQYPDYETQPISFLSNHEPACPQDSTSVLHVMGVVALVIIVLSMLMVIFPDRM